MREDFKLLQTGLIYFDNGATTLKPIILSEALSDYYNFYSSNAHRGDYSISLKASTMYENTRKKVKDFIGATYEKEIVFTSGCTDSLNKIVFGYFKYHLHEGDEILLTKSEHASNILPWFELASELDLVIKYIPLDNNHKVTIENVKNSITEKTKVISLAHITNVVGDVRPVKEICDFAHRHNILVVIDGAQSIPHIKVNVKEIDADFLTFSAHKMCGPTGVGVLYGKEKLLKETRPIIFGGGMNSEFTTDGKRIYKEIPDLLEAGTPNVAGVIAFGYIIDYLNNIGMDNIMRKEKELRDYLIKSLQKLPQIKIYNENSESAIIAFNYLDIFPQDLAIYLDKYNICVRAGSHCAKMLKEELAIKNTCRISLYFYNTKEEIDYLIKVLSNPNIKNELF